MKYQSCAKNSATNSPAPFRAAHYTTGSALTGLRGLSRIEFSWSPPENWSISHGKG